MARRPVAFAADSTSVPTSVPADRLLTIRDVAAHCQLSERTILRFITRKELVAFRLGGRWRIARRDLELFLRDRWRG